MKLLDSLSVYHGSDERRIEIYHGDLTALGPEEAVDVLIVSAFPDDYAPTSGSLIGALARKGVSVHTLAQRKAADLRKVCSCWMSEEIDATDPGIRFRRILCFEPVLRGSPPEVVGDIFRSLAPFVIDREPVRSVAMPLVATGDQRVPVAHMIEPLLDAAVHWMALEFPLERLKVVAHTEALARDLAREFAALKPRYEGFGLRAAAPKYEMFVSYAHVDCEVANLVIEEITGVRPGVRLFFDQATLDPGAAWQQTIYEAIDASRYFLALLSPGYLRSKVCQEEFNIALARRRNTGAELLFPL